MTVISSASPVRTMLKSRRAQHAFSAAASARSRDPSSSLARNEYRTESGASSGAELRGRPGVSDSYTTASPSTPRRGGSELNRTHSDTLKTRASEFFARALPDGSGRRSGRGGREMLGVLGERRAPDCVVACQTGRRYSWLGTVVARIPEGCRRGRLVRHPVRVADEFDVGPEGRAEVVDRLACGRTFCYRERPKQLLDSSRLHVGDRLVDVTDVEGDVLATEVGVLSE